MSEGADISVDKARIDDILYRKYFRTIGNDDPAMMLIDVMTMLLNDAKAGFATQAENTANTIGALLKTLQEETIDIGKDVNAKALVLVLADIERHTTSNRNTRIWMSVCTGLCVLSCAAVVIAIYSLLK